MRIGGGLPVCSVAKLSISISLAAPRVAHRGSRQRRPLCQQCGSASSASGLTPPAAPVRRESGCHVKAAPIR
jgi:hypothetical protein